MRRMMWVTLVCTVLPAMWGCGYRPIKMYDRPPQFRSFLDMKVGDAAPDFVLSDISGNDWRLSDQKGKLVVLQFASATSPPFVQALDDFRREVLSQYLLNPQVVFVYVFGEAAHPELLSDEARGRLERDPHLYRVEEARQYYYRLQFREGSDYNIAGLIPAASNVVILVDAVNNPAGVRYGYGQGGTTNPAFLIDQDGVVVGKGLFAAEFLSGSGYRAGNISQMIHSRLR